MTTPEYKVNRLLWESLEAALMAKGRDYVREMAEVLGVDERQLMQRVLPPSDKVPVALYETAATSVQCQALVKAGAVYRKCRAPVSLVGAGEYCVKHQTARPTLVETETTRTVRRLPDAPDRPALWALENGEVIREDGQIVGEVDGETVWLFREPGVAVAPPVQFS